MRVSFGFPWAHSPMRRIAALMRPPSGLAAGLGAAVLSVSGADAGKNFAGIQPVLREYCVGCHSTEKHKGDLDLERFRSVEDVRREPGVWQHVIEQIETGEMPPKDKPQMKPAERSRLLDGTRSILEQFALENAGDPGPVVLRRLSNAEYTFTVRDLLQVPALDPAREFPVDGAAGEGFVNTGAALVMSPSLLTKYVDASKQLAAHAVLLPDGIRFSRHTTRRDQTEEILGEIRALYRKYTDATGADRVNLQGIVFDTNEGGRLPLERYLRATIEERAAVARGGAALSRVAEARGLSPKYLGLLHEALSARTPSLLLDPIRRRWKSARPDDAAGIAADIARWQNAVWKFSPVGHIGKLGGPKAWMEPVDPVVARQDIRLKLARPTNSTEVTLRLQVGDAGDGNRGDVVRLVRPRFGAPGKPDLLLRDLRALVGELEARRTRLFGVAGRALAAAAEVQAATSEVDVAAVASRHGLDQDDLVLWLDYLGIGTAGTLRIDGYFTGTLQKLGGYEFVSGWGRPETPSISANSSDQHVRVPGNMRPHSVAVHPSPTLNAVVGWRSLVQGGVRVEGVVQHAHPECGNGVTWALELRRGATRHRLTNGIAAGGGEVRIGPIPELAVRPGDLLSVVVGPRDGNHSCDLTRVDLTLAETGGAKRQWNLAGDVSGDLLAGNPHADRLGNAEVWHFYTEPVGAGAGELVPAIPPGSIVSRWLSTPDAAERGRLAGELASVLEGRTVPATGSADARMVAEMSSLGGPLLGGARSGVASKGAAGGGGSWGLDPAMFGRSPAGVEARVEASDLCVQAPATIEIRVPADLVAGRDFVVEGVLEPSAGKEGTVQVWAVAEATPQPAVAVSVPFVTVEGGGARKRVEADLEAFRGLFPAALAYTKIVPVDEVVTLTLYHREDGALSRLMLDRAEAARLERLWGELHFVSQDALTLVDAFEQLWQYATQDADPKVFEPLREPIRARAEAFRRVQTNAEPVHVTAVVDFAKRAWRRPLVKAEEEGLRSLYARLRSEELPHEEAIRFLLARVLAAPSFLYKVEEPVPGAKPGPVSSWELASRLSYFLWSSQPDAALVEAASTGRLKGAEAASREAKRMLKDGRVRRLAEEFGCAWLHVHGFDTLDEKSERHFPTFAGLRGAMYEETVRFFEDLFRNDRPVTDLLDGDATFLNGALAAHYGVAGVKGDEWRRVSGMRAMGRGGVLGQATVLAKQSGASRTSPILRGNWLSEVLLGEKLPKPPKDVPRLPEDEAATEGLTVRQLTERHSTDPKCAGCHARIDPYGFALEGFDAIGRRREKDLGDRVIETRVRTPDGADFQGLEGLQRYLVTKRRDQFVRQFCRKLLGYSLGRSVMLSDEPLLREMESRLKAGGYRVGVAVDVVVRSPQFLNVRGASME